MSAGPLAARLLADLRRRGEPVGLAELAGRLVAAAGPLAPALARPIVAAALGRPAAGLPDPLPASALEPLPSGGADATPLERACFAVVDLETTGLSPGRAAILEIGAVRVRGLELAERYETLVDPARPIPPSITRLTGIDDALVAGAPTGGQALRGLRRFLDAPPGTLFVAHNARFDAGFVGRGFAGCGLAPLAEPVLCTRQLARRLAPELPRYGLDALAAAFGIRFRARHRAMGDAEVTAELLVLLLERARRDHGVRSVGDLVALHGRPPPRRRRPPRRSSGPRVVPMEDA